MTAPAASRDANSDPTVLCYVKVRNFDFFPLLGLQRQQNLVGMSCPDVSLYNVCVSEAEFPLDFPTCVKSLMAPNLQPNFLKRI